MKTKYCILIIRFKLVGGGGGGQVIFLWIPGGGGGGVIVHCIYNFLAGGPSKIMDQNFSRPPPDTQIMSSPLRPIQQSSVTLGWLFLG